MVGAVFEVTKRVSDLCGANAYQKRSSDVSVKFNRKYVGPIRQTKQEEVCVLVFGGGGTPLSASVLAVLGFDAATALLNGEL